MQAPNFVSISMVILSIALAFLPSSHADELPDLPEAFDAGWKGEKPCQLLYELETVRVARCSFAPGVGHEKHFHYPHFGYVLEGGTLNITNDAGVSQVRETVSGKSWSSDKTTIHEAVNIGDTTTSYLIIEPQAP